MAIDDELEKSSVAADIREESERTVQSILIKSGLAGMISLVPLGVGSAVNEMLTQFAIRRTHERMVAMFDEMARHVRDLGEEKIDRDWFRGEEFQTLLFEALHQLHVTRDKQKIGMLGKALANSGGTEFKEESRKQLFLQLIRELSHQHISCLHQLLPATTPSPLGLTPKQWNAVWERRPEVIGRGNDLLILQMLAANGLVEETLKANEVREPSVRNIKSQGDITRAIRSLLQDLEKPPLRYFCLSVLGMDFLKFVGSEPTNEQSPA